MGRPVSEVEAELEHRVAELSFDLVQSQWAGSGHRPILRIRIDVPEGSERELAGEGVTVDDCALVSRALEAWLDAHPSMPERYVLEVSSPGVDRPLTRRRDWERFAGERVVVKGRGPLAGASSRLEGELLGLCVSDDGSDAVRVKLDDGMEVDVPRDEVASAHLVYQWE